jgi:hypothetical protein
VYKITVAPLTPNAVTPITVTVSSGQNVAVTVNPNILAPEVDPRLPAPGVSGNVCTSDGSKWISAAPAPGGITGPTDSTLTQSGTTLGLNLANANTWLSDQTLTISDPTVPGQYPSSRLTFTAKGLSNAKPPVLSANDFAIYAYNPNADPGGASLYFDNGVPEDMIKMSNGALSFESADGQYSTILSRHSFAASYTAADLLNLSADTGLHHSADDNATHVDLNGATGLHLGGDSWAQVLFGTNWDAGIIRSGVGKLRITTGGGFQGMLQPTGWTLGDLEAGTITANNFVGPVTGTASGNIPMVAPGPSGNVLTSNGTAWTSAALPADTDTLATVTARGATTSVASSFTGGLSASAVSTGSLNVQTPTTSTVGAIIKGAAGQTADLQQWQASTGAVVAKVTKDGYLGTHSASATSASGWTIFEGVTGNYDKYLNFALDGATKVRFAPDGSLSLYMLSVTDDIYAANFRAQNDHIAICDQGINISSPGLAMKWASVKAPWYSATYDVSLSEASAGVLQVGDGGVNANGAITAKSFRLKGYTVATLPAGTQGDTAFVTDALNPTYLGVVSGGGTTVTPVFYDGQHWVAH